MNTAEYITSLIAGKVFELAVAGGVWSLFYTQRILFAASPKPPVRQPGEPEAKKGGEPAAEQPQADGERALSVLGGESKGEVA